MPALPARQETGTTAAFKLGGTGPLTGGAAIYGMAAQRGAQIAVDEIHEAGGDIQFDLRYEDDVHDPEKAVNAYNTLKEWGMQISLGSVTSQPGIATSAYDLCGPDLCPDSLRLFPRCHLPARTMSTRCASLTPTRVWLPPSTSPSRAWADKGRSSSGRAMTTIPPGSRTSSWPRLKSWGWQIVGDATFTEDTHD